MGGEMEDDVRLYLRNNPSRIGVTYVQNMELRACRNVVRLSRRKIVDDMQVGMLLETIIPCADVSTRETAPFFYAAFGTCPVLKETIS
jgi:hypothetical protein